MQPEPSFAGEHGSRLGFLSYSHADFAAAGELRERLRAAGLAVFKDDASIRIGDRWFEQLEAALTRSDWFLVLVGRDGIAGWVGAETQVALARHFSTRGDVLRLPIVPLLLADAGVETLPPFLALFQAARWAPGQDLPEELISTLRAAQPRFAPTSLGPDECPYRGLSAFRSQDSHLFFGRSAETLHAISLIGDKSAHPANPERPAPQAAGRDYRRWLQVEGNSGSGKSSLVQAGMLPMIERGALWPRTGISHWRIIGPMLPGTDPVTNLAEALERALRAELGGEARFDLQALRDRLRSPEPAALALLLRQHRPHRQRENGRYLLVIDQFEELITFAEPQARQAFDAQVAHALADPECPLFVISTVRSDFLDRFEQVPRLYELYSTQCERYPLPAIGTQGLREAIEMPSRLAEVDASEVASQILADARDEPGALPLAENALTALWYEARRDAQGRRCLSGEVYEQRGRLVGMLSQGADALLERAERELPGKGRRGALELLLALTRINPDGRHTRQRLPYEEAVRAADSGRFSPAGEKVLRLLAGERAANQPSDQDAQVLRLVTIEDLRHADGGVDARVVDLIHETLIRARGSGSDRQPYWPTLFAYVQAHRDRPLLRQQLTYRAERWLHAPPHLRWRHLAFAGGWWDMRRLPLAPRSAEGRFLRASRLASAAAALFVVLPLATIALSASWAAANHLPFVYAFTQLKWYAGFAPMPEVVAVPPGRFTMGCKPGRDDVLGASCDKQSATDKPLPAVAAVLTSACAIGKYEVTFEQFDYFVWSTGGKGFGASNFPSDAGWGRGRRPVINVSWSDAQRYVQWLSDKTGQNWRLPTEAEWERAARGGSDDTAFWWGNDIGEGRANCKGCDKRFGGERTAPVGSYACNPYGVCDTAGNVWEWVQDRVGSSDDPARVMRGGSWAIPGGARAAARFGGRLDGRNLGLGFRVCRGQPIG